MYQSIYLQLQQWNAGIPTALNTTVHLLVPQVGVEASKVVAHGSHPPQLLAVPTHIAVKAVTAVNGSGMGGHASAQT